MQRARRLSEEQRTAWAMEATEFPVTIDDQVSHIDIVFRWRRGETFLVAECKRPNPKHSRWCFVRAPFTWPGANGNELVFETVRYSPSNGGATASSVTARTSGTAYHLGVELRSGEDGDGKRRGPAIETSVGQVLRATSGLINHLFGPRRTGFCSSGRALFIPAIFTTADLWVSSIDLAESDLATGHAVTEHATRLPWLWFNHNQSPALRNALERSDVGEALSDALRHEFCRTIAIVSPRGIDDFLSRELNEWIRDS
jgi:hypothetical protein